ncbi:acyloxyacyl hydrolase [Shewanella nanhaiensis]|uniref:Acyloxyacyl hydrolase n=1 Tax=Shewanella nanhaiensis TaxID=2864872 RepID=A0ABS7E061_9GAMM|nr:acyloxyacyl hydrolase [Shewanella nanhaiensis]MBW8183052.1 acyloxyacyl hydrolase [Shewanella nanhaiensis]
MVKIFLYSTFIILILTPQISLANSGLTYIQSEIDPRWDGWKESNSSTAYRFAYVHNIEMDDNFLSRNNIDFNVEFAYHHWDDFLSSSKNGGSITPSLRYQIEFDYLSLYVELGIGATYLSSPYYGDRDMGSHWQFEDKLGAGVVLFKHHQLGFSFIHYSNANLAQKNDGLNAVGFSYGFFW